MKHAVLQFGWDNHLVGNWTACAGNSDTAMIFLDPGSDHRAGPNRLYADLSAALSSAGCHSFRFDYSGIGDSRPPHERRHGLKRQPVPGADAKAERRSGLSRELSEIEAAMDLLSQRFGVRRFVLFGLCSSADDALRSAAVDERVSGIVMIDGFAWRTRRFYLHYFLPRIFGLRRWQNFIQRKLGLIKVTKVEFVEEDFRNHLGQTEVRRILPGLLARSTQMLVVYTGEEQDAYCYAGQFRDMLPDIDFRDLLSLQFLPEADHTFACISAREKLLKLLTDWAGDLPRQ